LQAVALPPQKVCTQRVVPRGFILPDPACTPGAINPTVTINVLQDPNYRTSCTRDGATSAAQKNKTYGWYGLPHPANNTGANQFCELDHLISLELGGADTLENIWPQCGPDKVTLRERYFKQKDAVENYLAAQVKAGTISLHDAQWVSRTTGPNTSPPPLEVRWSHRFALRSVHRSQPSQQMWCRAPSRWRARAGSDVDKSTLDIDTRSRRDT
jgi:hypothetical protein